MQKIFVCSKCDTQTPKWAGRCGECGAWGSLKEEKRDNKQAAKKVLKSLAGSAAPVAVTTFSDLGSSTLERLLTSEFPAVSIFPKGIVLGGMTLLAGEPGAGKSTLALQLARNLSNSGSVLYISAEEAAVQVKERGERLGSFSQNFSLAESTKLEEIASTIATHKPQVVLVDSLQMLTSEESDAEAGSVNQVKIVTAALSDLAKKEGVAVIVIGHVTKDGALAGPKSLEHLVDTVLYLESDRNSSYRLLRCFKNRYGEAHRVVVMQLGDSGLKEVKNAASIFVHNFQSKPGSALTITVIDNQLFFIEVQALVSRSSFGYAKRTASGFPKARLELLLAIMKKHLHLDADAFDVYVNIAGGFRISEPAMDLAVVLAIVSSIKEESLPDKTVVFGEVGLSGELRVVKDTSLRLQEIEKQNYKTVYLPALDSKVQSTPRLIPAEKLGDVIKALGW